jgi:hypothetical protein
VSQSGFFQGHTFPAGFLNAVVGMLVGKEPPQPNIYTLYSPTYLIGVFYELKKLRVVTLNRGKSYLIEVSKKQRFLFEQFEVPVPVATIY